MVRESSSDASSEAGRGRTVLLALRAEIEEVKRGVYDQARQKGWRIRDLSYFDMRIPKPCRADGVLFRLRPEEGSLVRPFLQLGVPVVQLDLFVLPKRCCCVAPDREALGRIAAEHFAQRGFQNMAYLHADAYKHSKFRVVGDTFVQRARALGAKAELICVQRPGHTVAWTRFDTLLRRFEKELSKLSLPLGIFTYHDGMAVRICQFCEALGLSVPEQVAVLGLDNDAYKCDFAPTPLSSVDPNYYEQGRAGAELLDRLMNGEPPPSQPIVIPPAGIVCRHSTDVLALPDVETARALRYMWDHLAEAVGVDRIAGASGVSRRKLERSFRKHLHRSVTEELTRKRIERSCEMLRGTELTVSDIARQVGFRTETYFFRIFREKVGMTPKKYRLGQTARLDGAGGLA